MARHDDMMVPAEVNYFLYHQFRKNALVIIFELLRVFPGYIMPYRKIILFSSSYPARW